MYVDKQFPLLGLYVKRTGKDPLSSSKKSEEQQSKTNRRLRVSNTFHLFWWPVRILGLCALIAMFVSYFVLDSNIGTTYSAGTLMIVGLFQIGCKWARSKSDASQKERDLVEHDSREFGELLSEFCEYTGLDRQTVCLVGEEDLKAIAVGQLRNTAQELKVAEHNPNGNSRVNNKELFRAKHNLFYRLGLIEKGHWGRYFTR